MSDAQAHQPYPWQRQLWESLMARSVAGRLPHALLLSGYRGLGKDHFARSLAQALLCNNLQPDRSACGACRSCLLFQAGNHPDYYRISPEEEKITIGVDQIRSLGQWYTTTSHYAGYKIAVITPAEAMNNAAANSLLKTLEEPPARTVLLLVSSQPSRLLPTVRSRCQHVAFATPPREISLAWLAESITDKNQRELLLSLAFDAPLRAVALGESGIIAQRHELFAELDRMHKGLVHPVDIALRCQQRGVQAVIEWLGSWLTDLIRLGFNGSAQLVNSDFAEPLRALAEKIDIRQAYRYLDKLHEANRLAHTQVNDQMLLEDLLISWNGLANGR